MTEPLANTTAEPKQSRRLFAIGLDMVAPTGNSIERSHRHEKDSVDLRSGRPGRRLRG